MHKGWPAAVAATAALTLVSGCASTPAVESTSDAPVVVHGAMALPVDSVSDWVTYAQRITPVTVTSEKRLPATPAEVARGEGTITRQVELSLGKELWRQADFDVPAPGSTLRVTNGGWVFHGSKEQPWLVEDQTQLVVGHRYLAVLAYTSLTPDGSQPRSWTLLDALPFDEGRVGSGANRSYDRGAFQSREAVDGKGATDVLRLVKATKPDPRAKGAMNQDPMVRHERVTG